MDWMFLLFLLPGLVIGITVHEAAHAISAKWLGDSTAEKMGRVSLNPMRHLSPMGAIAFFIIHIGWGKPVLVNLYNFKKPKFYYLLTSLAGPASNLILSAVTLGLLYALQFAIHTWISEPGYIANLVIKCIMGFLESIFVINAMLAVFNLLPIPPLDGSKIWPCLIPGMRPLTSGKWSMIWVVVLLAALYSGTISKVISPVMRGVASLVPTAKVANQSRPKDYPAILIYPKDANRAKYFKRLKDGNNSYDLKFNVSQAYPAEDLMSFMETNFVAQGWSKRQFDLMKPQESQWEIGEDEYSTYHHMNEYWQGPQGQKLSLVVSARFPEESPEELVSVSVWMCVYFDESPTDSPLAASEKVENEVRPTGFPRVLVYPEDAWDAKYFKRLVDGKKSYDLRFVAKEVYPAINLRSFLTENLTLQGWVQLQYDPAEPELPVQTEWSIQKDKYSDFRSWNEHWQGPDGQMLSLALAARFEEDLPYKPVRISVWMCVYYSKSATDSPLAAAIRR